MVSFHDFVAFEEMQCQLLLEQYKPSKLACPPHFDGIFCWPSAASSGSFERACPIVGREGETMTRWCSANISEITNPNIVAVSQWNEPHYGRCSLRLARTGDIVYLFTLSVYNRDDAYLHWWHDKISVLDDTGYLLSAISLLIALSIFAGFSQLQDGRVKVHINLFIAMLLQAIFTSVQNYFFGCAIYYTFMLNSPHYRRSSSAACRALMTFSHYFELTIFTWLLIEGWYFYSLISRAPYKDHMTIKPHILAGWGSPLVVIIPWLIIHFYSSETNFCWVDVDIKINIMSIPILIVILINLCFFILNVRIIFIKMKSTYMSQRRMHYWKWIKSSLMLVPLFGTYDLVYGIWPWLEDQHFKIILLVIMRTICCLQGFIVSTLYCFTNNHVKKEIRRALNNWKLKRQINKEISKPKKNLPKINEVKTVNDCRVIDSQNYF